MLAIFHQFQVFFSIILSVAIYMVHALMGVQQSAQDLFHDQNLFHDILTTFGCSRMPWAGNAHISVVNDPAAFVVVVQCSCLVPIFAYSLFAAPMMIEGIEKFAISVASLDDSSASATAEFGFHSSFG